MTYLIIPDIHEQHEQLKRLWALAPPHDARVYLGDWFDSFTRTPDSTTKTLQLLLSEMRNNKNIFLLGNHDAHYLSEASPVSSGYHTNTYVQVYPHKDYLCDRMQFAVTLDDWVLSHAGFNRVQDMNEALQTTIPYAKHGHSVWRVGRSRGGNAPFGGCMWLDWHHEFTGMDKHKQLVGHTPSHEVRHKSGNVCLDTHLRDFVVLRDGELELHKIQQDTDE